MKRLTKIMKNKKLLHLILGILILNGIQIHSVFSQNNEGLNISPVTESAEENKLSSEENYFLSNQYIIDQLKKRLLSNKNLTKNLAEKIEKTKEKIADLSEDINTLDGQLGLLKRQIALTEKKILDITKYILESENRIRILMEEIDKKNIELEEQKRLIAEYFELIYYHKNHYYEIETKEINAVKILMDSKYLSETLKEETYLSILENAGEDIFQQIEIIKKGMEVKHIQLEEERKKLVNLNHELVDQKKKLEMQQLGKEKLLEQTKGQKEIFHQMLMQSLDQEREAEQEISMLFNNINYFNGKIEKAKETLTPEDYEEIKRIKEEFESGNIDLNLTNQSTFPIWPVIPRSISAYFDDQGYQKVFGVPHRALDIPTPQGTPILSPDKGIILKVRDNGFGYSYIVIAHRNNLITVYGHVSKILVQEGEFIEMGQIIGLSGGGIGTPGAGVRTTGPHLHFEVHKGGIKVDPLDYLKLEALPIEYLPVEKIKKYSETNAEAIVE